MRRVICAACSNGKGLVIAGARHFDRVMVSQLRAISQEYKPLVSEWMQGFIDQHGVFMSREEAMIVAIKAGQDIDFERGCGGSRTILYSEGLY